MERSWRVGHTGRDMMYYEELHNGRWERIAIDGEMMMGRAHHAIYFKGVTDWQRYPAWAHGRRDEIIARVTSEFREPDYEYWGRDPGRPLPFAEADRAPPVSPPPVPSPLPPSSSAGQGRGALLLATVLLLVVGLGLVWLVVHGIMQGETPFFTRDRWLRRPVVRAVEPTMYWVTLCLYAAAATGLLTLAGLGVRAGRRLRFW